MKSFTDYSRAWHQFSTREPKFSVLIAILSIIVLGTIVFCMQSPQRGAWFCTLSELSVGVVRKAIQLQNHGV